MPALLIHLHHIIHAATGGLDCLIIIAILAPYFAYRIWIKKDFNIKKFIKHGSECHCHEHKKDKKTKK